MSLAEELRALAEGIARDAGALARRRRIEGIALAATKSTVADIVTDADREVEALIRRRLRTARPDDGFYGEESGSDEGASGVTWVVDPIDGTVNYASGIPSYCVSIAAVTGTVHPDAWHVIVGVVYAPELDELFAAVRGGGAWHAGRRMQVTTQTPAGALLATGFGYDPATHQGDLATVAAVMPMARDLRRMGAAALDLAYVAAGRLDGFFERGLQPWDYAAGSLLVTEAGGRFTQVERERPRRMTVAGGPAVHDALLSVISPEN